MDSPEQPTSDLSGNEKKRVARRRWAILAKALKSPANSEPSSPIDEFSVRRISSLMLLSTQQLPFPPMVSTNHEILKLMTKRKWFLYSLQVENSLYSVNVGHNTHSFSAEDLMGFNNTGNICIWPSEEALTVFVCSNLFLFNNKRVLELGGGMSCLAGLFVAKYSLASQVLLTDGNLLAVENVSLIVKANEFTSPTQSKVLKWNEAKVDRFDYILCADCLFFDEARMDLIECLWKSLDTFGTAFVMAPKRGKTLESFVAKAELKGFKCKVKMNYNELVWDRRCQLLGNCDFDDNIHYPILIEMTKFKCP